MNDGLDEEVAVDVSQCSNCEDFTDTNVLKIRKGDRRGFANPMSECNEVQTLHLRPGKPIMIILILSDGAKVNSLESDDDELISVDMYFDHSGILTG